MDSAALRVPPDADSIERNIVHATQSPLTDVKKRCRRIASSEATVLLTGETGTGKEVFARLIHARSARANRPFVAVNCGAIPEALLESELFGVVKGAYTGAASSRRGRVALAEGGTLFLDEIGELSLPLQVKLLRLLQEHTYEPVGSSESVAANFRLVAATNRDLAAEVKASRFRGDLFYRLHVCPVHLPPLRERPCDVAVLFNHFWRRHGETRPVRNEVMLCLERYAWPGNVRELENLVERLSVCAEGPEIALIDLPVNVIRGDADEGGAEADRAALAQLAMPSVTRSSAQPSHNRSTNADIIPLAPSTPAAVRAAAAGQGAADFKQIVPVVVDDPPGDGTCELVAFMETEKTPVPVRLPVDFPTMAREVEDAYIAAALRRTGNNKKEAAKLLGMGRTTLVEKLRRRQGQDPDGGDQGGGTAPSSS